LYPSEFKDARNTWYRNYQRADRKTEAAIAAKRDRRAASSVFQLRGSDDEWAKETWIAIYLASQHAALLAVERAVRARAEAAFAE
jgi:hypothetical protein